MLPPAPTQLYLGWIRFRRKISFVMSFTISKWLKKYYSYKKSSTVKTHRMLFFIYFWHRFGLANAINNHLISKKKKLCIFNPINAYLLNLVYKIWVRFIFVYQKTLKQTFLPVFENKITFWNFVLLLWIHNFVTL